MLSAIGFVMVAAMVILIIRGRIALLPILILLPSAAVLILCLAGVLTSADGTAAGMLGYLKMLKTYLDIGLTSVQNIASLFTFAIIFCGVMGDAGMFDAIVSAIVKRIGNNISLILLMTCILTAVSHLDGSGAATMLITIPTMLPLFRKMKLDPVLLLLYVGLTSGVVNMLPWTSALARVSAATGVNARLIWHTLLPVQISGLAILCGSCFVLGPVLKRKGCGMSDDEFAELKSGLLAPTEHVLNVSRRVLTFDIALNLIIVLSMLLGWVDTNIAFMLGVSVALIVNCSNAKEMTSQIKKHGSTALNMVMVIFSIGMLVGTMKESGMITAMTGTLVGLLPESMGRHLTFLIAMFCVPLSMLLGSDTVYMIMTPIFGEMAVQFGGTVLQACCATVIGSCIAANLCLVGPTPYLALGLAGVEMRDNLKRNFVPTWVFGVVLALMAVAAGAFPV